MTIDIICPLYNAEKYIDDLQKSIEMQKNVKINTIRYIITKGKDNTEQKVKNISNCIYHVIESSEFSHSLVREKEAYNCKGDILVFITQDVKIEKDDWLEKLVSPIEKGECDA